MEKFLSKILKAVICFSVLGILILVIAIASIKPVEKINYGEIDEYQGSDVIFIDTLDTYGMGVMHDNKFYQLQYGVHVRSEDYVGEQIGIASDENRISLVSDKSKTAYAYKDCAVYGVHEGSPIYTFNGNADVLLVKNIYEDYEHNPGGYWVLAPEVLEKCSMAAFLEDQEGLTVCYYPLMDEDNYNTKFELTPEETNYLFQTSYRVTRPESGDVVEQYITVDDGSGLVYGYMCYLDYINGVFYMNTPTYTQLFYRTDGGIMPVLDRILSDLEEAVKKAQEKDPIIWGHREWETAPEGGDRNAQGID